jgi:hypothetical protein
MREKKLDRNRAIEPLVTSTPHFSHAAGADAALHDVDSDAVTRLDRPALPRDLACEKLKGWERQEVARSVQCAKERRRFLSQRGIVA